MVLSNKKGRDNSAENLGWLNEDDPFGLNEEIKMVIFKCIDCNKTDEVPEYIIGEFSVDKKEGEEVELHCPYCNGTMLEARNIPSD
ncbi:hypothetical protein DTX80_11170 [Bacilli bacterium]|uniref:Uncharacterized protein n=2 Tax=Oceanobacillus caeni TaxID=405946 RepID=A0ABR5MEY5_9BACI|nr:MULTISPECIES: hypothetical protein [Bacillaceae]KKE77722.1 hypothetical protein WH51_16680 [Bacilli bacterium VT-13-104]PZD81346.1 hypothetical protein DEJ64_17730 [Bacilli bacterium]KKE79442.1 hypothetical protein WH51_08070 [Bacilli bacterium VT-13-104]KPH67900.1 hypothetical protein AFL42_17670 [Oceanobacillus caeni]MBU8789887.1 hypothetical protein [Oceanobacillus caeni]